MILDIDAGNSRIKWRLSTNGLSAVAAMQHRSMLPEAFVGAMLKLPLREIRLIRVANVRGGAFAEALEIFFAGHCPAHIRFAASTSQFGDLKNAYAEPARLGVDRWLAMVAAWQDCREACCIVDCGSALTVDLIDAAGQHRGGYIVPGLNLLQAVLRDTSQALETVPFTTLSLSPGENTGAAINHGILLMIHSLLACLGQGDAKQNCWYLTGGDAEQLAGLLTRPYRLRPELVMEGLALVLGETPD